LAANIFCLEVWHFLALFFEVGVKFSSMAVTLYVGISLAGTNFLTLTNDHILDGTVEHLVLFVSELHCIWYFTAK